MALSVHDALATTRRGRRRRGRRGALSEINVTPLVDVMLVLLIIFMVSAPLLNVGVPVDLPKTDASATPEEEKPVAVTIGADGALHLQEEETTLEGLVPALQALPAASPDKPIFVRADGRAPYEVVAKVMARLSTSGFTKLNLLTDTAAPEASARTGG
ncbi:MAG: ExbD/TolR family protein [Caulobacteraceae bacterium]|nr:ExbD/TolR family protein [Caulobacter sp.]